MDSKMKALQWEKLTAEFYAYIGDQNMVSKAQLVRKWHNWKQYNKGASIEFISTYLRKDIYVHCTAVDPGPSMIVQGKTPRVLRKDPLV